MAKKIGSQYRESPEEGGYILLATEGKEAILFDTVVEQEELWVMNDHYSGYVVEIGGKGYEFVRQATKFDMKRIRG